MRLNRRRSAGLGGANAITHIDMQAFCALAGVRLEPWEVEAIETLDDMFRAEMARTTAAPK